MNAVSDAFAQGNVIVVAGETHGQLNDAAEEQAWQSLGIKVAIDSINVTSEKAGYRGGLTPVRAELANSAGLKHEIKSAIALEDNALAQFSDRPRLARSAGMALRLLSWGPSVTPKALWKIGENHINDFDQLQPGTAHNVRIMHKAEYLPALRSAVSPLRSQQTVEYLQQQPLGPLMDYMVEKGWVRQPT